MDLFVQAQKIGDELEKLVYEKSVIIGDEKYLIIGYDFSRGVLWLEGGFEIYFDDVGKYQLQ